MTLKNCRLLVFLLLAAAAFGQTTEIHGLKIKESAFDATTMTLSLTFINDRAADVTAYDYCFTAPVNRVEADTQTMYVDRCTDVSPRDESCKESTPIPSRNSFIKPQ